MPSIRCTAVAAGMGALAILLGCITWLATNPSSVTPPVTPTGSPTEGVPPWPIFCVAVALNDFFEMAAWATRPPAVQAKSLATAYWRSEVTYSLAYNGVIDEVGSAASPVSCRAVAAKLELAEDFLCRMMVAGESIKLFTSDSQGLYSLTAAGELFRKDHPNSMRPWLMMINEESRDAWRTAGTKSLKHAESGFKLHFGEEFFDFHSKPEQQRQMAQFDGAMEALSSEIVGALLLDWAPPQSDAMFCDIGGGKGHVVATIAQHYPNLKGLVLDLPPAASRATSHFESQNLSSRLEAVPGSFFEPMPEKLASCDVFYMRFVLHDWDDASCKAILQNIMAVAKPGAKIVSTDFILGLDGPEMETAKRLFDINMMASNTANAKERSFSQYSSLFADAGIKAQPKLIKTRDATSTVEVQL